MTMPVTDLNLLVAFDALFEERHVTRAAKRIGIGQPSMSAALARLRRDFGDELFVATSYGMQPTTKALRLGPAIAAVLASIRTTLGDELPFDPTSASGVFTIASTDYTTLVLLPRLVARLRELAPSIDLRIVGYDKAALPGMLDRGEIDLAVGVFRDPTERFVLSALFRERFVGLVRHGHPAFAAGFPDLAAFAAIPQALVTLRQDERGAIDEDLQVRGHRRRVAVTLPHMMALPAMLRQTDLVAVLPERVVQGAAAAGLMAFDLPLDTSAWEVSMLWNPTTRFDNRGAWLRGLIATVAKAC